MVMTDPIADFLTRIRNANQAKHEVLEVPASNIKKGIAEILKRADEVAALRGISVSDLA
jgi:small subunit ribosomal protein S8